jgi:hypothetical protein
MMDAGVAVVSAIQISIQTLVMIQAAVQVLGIAVILAIQLLLHRIAVIQNSS